MCLLFENANVFVLLDAKDIYKTEYGCWLLMLTVYYLACIFSCQLLIAGMHLCDMTYSVLKVPLNPNQPHASVYCA